MPSETLLALAPLAAKSVTLVPAELEVNTTLAVETVPVVKPVRVPEYPRLVTVFAAVPVALMLAKAAATLAAVTVVLACVLVTVMPARVNVWPAVRSLKVTVTLSVTPAAPSVLAIVGMVSPVTMLPTLPLLVAVAVTTAPLLAPVVKPSAKVPLKLPLLKVAVVDAAAAAKADMPDFKLENAVANSLLVVVPVEVKVNPLSVKPCPADSCGKVMALVSLAPNALAAAPETPVTPKGLEGGVVSKPKPKSEPCTEVESYQTDKFLPSGVVSVKPPVPLSPATTPCTVVPALILSITYWRRWLSVWLADKLRETFSPLTYKSV